MTDNDQNKSDSTKTPEDEKKSASTAFWQAARAIGGPIAAAVILIGMAASKIGRRGPGGP